MTLPITQRGVPFAVSTFSAPTLSFPDSLSIAGLVNGYTVVAWRDGSDAAVQLFNADGATWSREFHPALSGGASETLTNENVVALANGNFVVTWNDTVGAGTNNPLVTVDAQIYDPNLNAVGGRITVIPQFSEGLSLVFTGADVFATPDGGFAYAESANQSEFVQAFHADGSKNGAAHQTGPGFFDLFSATALTNGNYVTLTALTGPDAFWIYDKSGNQIIGPTPVAGNSATNGDIAALPDGRFVIVYDDGAVAAQIYNPDGSTFGNQIVVNNGFNNAVFGDPHVSAMPDGRFVVSWYDTSGDAGNNLTEVRVFNPDGTAATDVFAIPGSTEATGADTLFHDVTALGNDVTALGNNSFAVDWKTNATIEGQVFSVPSPTTPAGTTADLILRETTGANTGQLDAFDLGGNAILAAFPLGGLGLNWQILGLGAFAGVANEADMIVRDSSTGNLEFFDIQGGQFAGEGAMGQLGNSVKALGVGDFSGNANETDLLMRDSNFGNLYVLDVQHNQFTNVAVVGNVGGSWQALGVGDFGGNANETDLIMRDSNTGNIDFFDIQHNQIVAAGAMGAVGMSWQALGVGDFSGNPGESDLIMRDSNTGNIEYFDIQHNQFVAMGSMGSVGLSWQVLGFGDFSGNPGESDMVMRDGNTGNIEYFDIQHNQFTGMGSLGNVGTDWQTLGVGSPLILGSPLV